MFLICLWSVRASEARTIRRSWNRNCDRRPRRCSSVDHRAALPHRWPRAGVLRGREEPRQPGHPRREYFSFRALRVSIVTKETILDINIILICLVVFRLAAKTTRRCTQKASSPGALTGSTAHRSRCSSRTRTRSSVTLVSSTRTRSFLVQCRSPPTRVWLFTWECLWGLLLLAR